MSSGSRFLARWSRLKKAGNAVAAAEVADPASLLENLGPDSDFGVFLGEEVSEGVRRQAMKTLFSDPRFNVMDGLDIYIDDYSVSEAIPEEMLATLNQARTLFETPAEGETDGAAAPQHPSDCDILSGDRQNVAMAATKDEPAS